MNHDEEPRFVTRRGKAIGVSQVDLSGIDIDSDTLSPETRPSPEPTTQKKKFKRSRGKRTLSRRAKTIIAAVLLVIIAVPLITGEVITAQYRSGVTEAKSKFSKLVDGTVLNSQKKTTISSDQIAALTTDVDGIASKMCQGGMVDNIAGLYPRAKTALSDCKTAQTKYSQLVSSLRDLQKQATYLEQLGVVLKPISTPLTDEYAVIGAQQTAWQTASDGVKKLVPPTALSSAHAELSSHVSAVTADWSKLNTANNAQNAMDFSAAEKDLATEYDAVRAVNAKITGVIAATQSTISRIYNLLK